MERDKESFQTIKVNPILFSEPIVDPHRFSSWRRLVRVTYIQRFVNLCRDRNSKSDKKDLTVTTKFYNPSLQELKDAENYWIIFAQRNLSSWNSKYNK